MNRKFVLARGVLFAAWLLACGAGAPAFAASGGCEQHQATSPAGDEVKAYIDPKTGELVEGPPPGQAELPDAPGAAQPEPEYPTRVLPDGTVELDLSQRPQETLYAETVDGQTVLCHGEALPAPPSE